ncbi:Sucrose synthase 2 [Zea mays]|uniref:sucrose synthase n=1 Tax=Zea mays TaxID=4577 RepID=A0A3L6FFC0_MAIZE|nr:Sucrose synthase 2 [Zea mays]
MPAVGCGGCTCTASSSPSSRGVARGSRLNVVLRAIQRGVVTTDPDPAPVIGASSLARPRPTRRCRPIRIPCSARLDTRGFASDADLTRSPSPLPMAPSSPPWWMHDATRRSCNEPACSFKDEGENSGFIPARLQVRHVVLQKLVRVGGAEATHPAIPVALDSHCGGGGRRGQDEGPLQDQPTDARRHRAVDTMKRSTRCSAVPRDQKVVYILGQVRAMDNEMLLRIKQYGLDMMPKILFLSVMANMVTRLLLDATGPTCGQHLEKVLGTKHCNIICVPFRTENGTIRKWSIFSISVDDP